MSVCGHIHSHPRYLLGERCSSSQLAATRQPVTPKRHRFASKTPQCGVAPFNGLKSMSLGALALLEGRRPGHRRDVRSLALVQSKEGGRTFCVREAEEKDLQETAEVIIEAFQTFSDSVGQVFDATTDQVLYAVRKLHGHPRNRLLVAVAQDGNGSEGDVIGVTGFRIEDPIASIQIVAVSTSKSAGGVGRTMVNHAIDICQQRGENSIVCLTQDSSNGAAFALYASMGFEVIELCIFFEGFVSDAVADEAIEVAAKTGTTFRKMEEGDVAKCNEMFMNLVGHSRLNNITDRQRDAEPQPSLVGVKVRDGGQEEVVAYTTSFTWFGHSVAVDEQHLKALVSYGSKVAKEEGRGEVIVLCMARVNPDVVQWALKAGLRVKRQLSVMAKGGRYSINPDFVYAPGPDY